ncbi:hypothetical protein FHU33_2324 [Blastococcus colisei]|uniref:Peptidase C25-like protein n=1 Tax=Blastococcus colisei TaxID=1564162 RepID=A0A543PFQ9_9ACTN|nr:hypothetical protein [Blastococcus colisei]TQN42913.1 hypothetical protein FHU33_2324 [Blastococcus colisei]
MADQVFCFNGVDGVTGSYLLPPVTPATIFRRARGFAPDPHELDELRYRRELATRKVLGPGEGRDPCDLSQVGWGVLFAQSCAPSIRDALRPLLDHRRAQVCAGGDDRYYREFWGEDAYRPGESKTRLLARYGAGPGPVDPGRVPYYLLLVGGPSDIPFSVQYQLDVQYAVGRLYFQTPDEYRGYADGVVAAETTGVPRSRSVAFFAPQNPGDRATELSRSELVEPLAQRLATDHADWDVRASVGEDATKPCLLELLTGDSSPALLFTAGHGVGWPAGHPHQARRQGALVCQEWPGPDADDEFTEEHYLGADDVPDDAHVHGLVALHFACFGAGTPEWDEFAHREAGSTPERLAPEPFVSTLPRRLLGHENGPALAVAGHVDRAWGYSFKWPGAGRQTEVYRSCLARLLRGHPIGSAFDYVNQRYAELAADLSAELHEVQVGRRPDHVSLSAMWTANNDARGFVVLGDPAVRLPAFSDGQDAVPGGAARSARGAEPPGAGSPLDDGPIDTPELGTDGSWQAAELPPGSRRRLVAAAQELADVLAEMVRGARDPEVAVYGAEEPSVVRREWSEDEPPGAELRFLARAGLGGDVRIVVTQREGGFDTRYSALGLDALRLAQEERRQSLRYLAMSLAALLRAEDDATDSERPV